LVDLTFWQKDPCFDPERIQKTVHRNYTEFSTSFWQVSLWRAADCTVQKCTRGEVYNELCDVTSRGAGHLLLQPTSENRQPSDLSNQATQRSTAHTE